ncbi:sulfatase-like hydrolase/transferase [Salipiger pacificus]|nr:sulfatase-like hydrolase/transferase [Alloyangia pacifica]MCA0946979.1 sulfatase-like hydrolase/transferase [Alloyangia pacifica]
MQPNILMLFPDQWRGDWIAALGDLPLRTPNIDALIARGTSLGRAWTPSPLCAPARSCLATGKRYGEAPVLHNQMDNPFGTDTFYARLRDVGYQTGNAGKSDLLKGGDSWGATGRHVIDGTDQLAGLGFTHGMDSCGKKAAEKILKSGAVEPYTQMLKARGLEAAFLEDYARRPVSTPDRPPMADWISGRIATPPGAFAYTEPAPLPDEAYNDNFVGRVALDTLQGFDKGQPWFLMVNFPGPHDPMDVTASMLDGWDEVTFPLPRLRETTDPERQQRIRRRYAAMIENIDRWIGRYLAHLEESGQLGNTLVVFASDHGEMLGDRNLWKKQVPFEPSVHVPMVLAGPGVPSRGHLAGLPGNLLDLPPTFLALAGAEVPADYAGFDLSGWLGGGSYPRETTCAGLGPWRAICDGRYKLVCGFRDDLFQEAQQFEPFDPESFDDGLLHDLHEDPEETRNLWAALPEVRDRLLAALREEYGPTLPSLRRRLADAATL